MSRLFFTAILLMLTAGTVTAQDRERVRILRTDSLSGQKTKNGMMNRWIGHVKLQTEKATIECDSAWHFPDQKKVQAFGRIRIWSEDDRLWAEKLDYDLRRELCTFSGPVIIQTPGSTLFTTDGVYNLKASTAHFSKPIFVRDKKGEIAAQSGMFFTKRDSARLAGRVQLQDSLLYLEADSLNSGRKSGLTQASGKLYIRHRTDRWQVNAGRLESDTLGYRLFQRDVAYLKVDSAGTDTTWLAAEWLRAIEKDRKNTLTGRQNIRIWNPDYSAVSDSLFYNEASGAFQLRKAPLLWTERQQLKAPRFDMQLKDGKVDLLLASPRPFMSERDSATGRIHQITGDSLRTEFREGDPHRMQWNGSIQMVYHTKKDSAAAPGMMVMGGRSLDIRFKNRKPDRMTGSRDVKGYFSEKPDSAAAMKLPGYAWQPERKPGRPARLPAPRFREAALDSLKQLFRIPEL